MVILAGNGHVPEGFGIPDRLARRLKVSRVIVLNGSDAAFESNLADVLLLSLTAPLAPAGRLGVRLEPGGEVLRFL